MNSRYEYVYFLEVTGLFPYSSVLAFQKNDKEPKDEIRKEKEQHKKKV